MIDKSYPYAATIPLTEPALIAAYSTLPQELKPEQELKFAVTAYDGQGALALSAPVEF